MLDKKVLEKRQKTKSLDFLTLYSKDKNIVLSNGKEIIVYQEIYIALLLSLIKKILYLIILDFCSYPFIINYIQRASKIVIIHIIVKT